MLNLFWEGIQNTILWLYSLFLLQSEYLGILLYIAIRSVWNRLEIILCGILQTQEVQITSVSDILNVSYHETIHCRLQLNRGLSGLCHISKSDCGKYNPLNVFLHECSCFNNTERIIYQFRIHCKLCPKEYIQ